MEVRRTADGRPRSVAWIFYGLLAVLGAIGLVTNLGHLAFWGVELLLILYTRYLYRGGRFVLFFA